MNQFYDFNKKWVIMTKNDHVSIVQLWCVYPLKLKYLQLEGIIKTKICTRKRRKTKTEKYHASKHYLNFKLFFNIPFSCISITITLSKIIIILYIDVSLQCSEDKPDKVPSCVNYKGQAGNMFSKHIYRLFRGWSWVKFIILLSTVSNQTLRPQKTHNIHWATADISSTCLTDNGLVDFNEQQVTTGPTILYLHTE